MSADKTRSWRNRLRGNLATATQYSCIRNSIAPSMLHCRDSPGIPLGQNFESRRSDCTVVSSELRLQSAENSRVSHLFQNGKPVAMELDVRSQRLWRLTNFTFWR